MAISTLESLFRESKNRSTDRAAFEKAMSRLSNARAKRGEDQRKPAKDEQKAN